MEGLMDQGSGGGVGAFELEVKRGRPADTRNVSARTENEEKEEQEGLTLYE